MQHNILKVYTYSYYLRLLVLLGIHLVAGSVLAQLELRLRSGVPGHVHVPRCIYSIYALK